MAIHQLIFPTITGVSGTATPNKVIEGKIKAIYFNYSASAAATTDVTVATANAPVTTIVTISNNNGDGWIYPRHQVHNNVGVALTMDGTQPLVEAVCVADYVTCTVAQNSAGESVTITLIWES